MTVTNSWLLHFSKVARATRKNHVKKKDMQYLYLKKDTLGIACPNPQYQEVLSWGTWYWVSCLSSRARKETPKRTPKHFVRDTNEIILVGWGQGMHYVPLPNRQEYFICTRSVGSLGWFFSRARNKKPTCREQTFVVKFTLGRVPLS